MKPKIPEFYVGDVVKLIPSMDTLFHRCGGLIKSKPFLEIEKYVNKDYPIIRKDIYTDGTIHYTLKLDGFLSTQLYGGDWTKDSLEWVSSKNRELIPNTVFHIGDKVQFEPAYYLALSDIYNDSIYTITRIVYMQGGKVEYVLNEEFYDKGWEGFPEYLLTPAKEEDNMSIYHVGDEVKLWATTPIILRNPALESFMYGIYKIREVVKLSDGDVRYILDTGTSIGDFGLDGNGWEYCHIERVHKPQVTVTEIDFSSHTSKFTGPKFQLTTEKGERIDKTNNTKIPTITTTATRNVNGKYVRCSTTCDKFKYDMYMGAIVAAAKITATQSKDAKMMYNIARNCWGTDISKSIFTELANTAFEGNFQKVYDKFVKEQDKPKYDCHYCHKKFMTEEELEEHIEWHENCRKARKERRATHKRAKSIATHTLKDIEVNSLANNMMVDMWKKKMDSIPERITLKDKNDAIYVCSLYESFNSEQKRIIPDSYVDKLETIQLDLNMLPEEKIDET